MKKTSAFIMFLVFVVSSCCFCASAESVLPAPEWVTVMQNSDGSKTLTITTPVHMLDYIDYYEYSTDGFKTTKILRDNKGGEFIFSDSCEFSLRYSFNDQKSEIHVEIIEINNITVVTNKSTNISVVISKGSTIPTDIKISAYEIINGKDYNIVANILGSAPFRIYNVSVMHNNSVYETSEPYIYLFPGGNIDATNANIYHLDSRGTLTIIPSVDELTMLAFLTEKTGIFIVAEDGVYRNGDMDGDGYIMAKDARTALRISAELDECSDLQFRAGDLNKNNMIDASDARLILRKSASV